MKLTKYQHACVVLEEQGQKLIIDPGGWTENFGNIANVAAVVITHVHGDHCSPDHIAQILAANPGTPIFSTAQVADQLAGQQVTVAEPGQTAQVGPFSLAFYGGQHAPIRPGMPADQNIGVLVNNQLYYGGDSFVAPEGATVAMLALPVSAPWLKFSEVADYLTTVRPQACFATHNAILSDTGQQLLDRLVGTVCQETGCAYHTLKPGDSVEF